MNAGNLIFLLLIVGSFVAMFSMHRGGGHAHGGMGGGGCGGGHGDHSHDQSDETTREGAHEHGQKPLLGPPGTQSNEPAPEPAQGHRHRGC